MYFICIKFTHILIQSWTITTIQFENIFITRNLSRIPLLFITAIPACSPRQLNLLSAFIALLVLEISYKWNYPDLQFWIWLFKFIILVGGSAVFHVSVTCSFLSKRIGYGWKFCLSIYWQMFGFFWSFWLLWIVAYYLCVDISLG